MEVILIRRTEFFVIIIAVQLKKPWRQYEKQKKRKLITDEKNSLLSEKLNFYFILMAGYIKSIGKKPFILLTH